MHDQNQHAILDSEENMTSVHKLDAIPAVICTLIDPEMARAAFALRDAGSKSNAFWQSSAYSKFFAQYRRAYDEVLAIIVHWTEYNSGPRETPEERYRLYKDAVLR